MAGALRLLKADAVVPWRARFGKSDRQRAENAMAFQAVPDTAEIDIIYALNGEIVQNVFYATMPGGYVLADLQALADQIDLQVQGTWKAQQPPEAVYVRTEVRGLAFANDKTAQQSLSAGPGVHGGAALPNQVTFSIKKTSGFTGRSARGRTYWIGVPNGILLPSNENLVSSVWAAATVSAVGSIRSAIGSVGLWEPVLVSRFTEGAQRPVGITFAWVGETNVDARVDTNRNRLPTL